MALPMALLGLLPGLIDKGVEIFDKKFQTSAEKDEAVREHIREVQEQIEQVWDKEQAHITERHKNDMTSDSWLSKNIRPLTLVYLMGLFTLAFITDVEESILGLLKELMMTVFVFYFGARGLEKIVGIAKKS